MTNQQRNSRHPAKLLRGEGVYQPLLWEQYPLSEDNLTTQQVKERFHLRPSVIQQARKKTVLRTRFGSVALQGTESLANHWNLVTYPKILGYEIIL
ncbi:UNVERIFIED_CONTAM: hypothetical protein BEN50_03685 [Euhalothece sp. KZN 001]